MKILNLIVCLILSLQTQGQYFTSLQPGDTTNDFASNIVWRPDNTLLILSNAIKLTGSPYKLFGLVTNADASVQLSKHFIQSDTFSYSYGYTGTIRALPSGYLMDVTTTAPSTPANGYSSQATLAKYDSQGAPVFLRSYTDTNLYWEYGWTCLLLKTGAYLLGGERQNFAQTDNPAMLWKTDTSGNLLWAHQYEIEPGNRTQVNSLDTIDDNRILVGLFSRSIVYTNPAHYYYSNQPWFVIVDTQGTILRDTFYSSGRYSGGGFIFKDKAGGYFHYGTLDSVFNPNYIDEPANFPPYVAHLDTNFRIDWLTSFVTDTGIAKNIWAVKQLHDSGYIVVGNYYDYPMHIIGWAARINKYGAIIWDNIYPDYPQYDAYLVDAIELPDHNIIMVGTAKDVTLPAWRDYDAWILGVDSNGCEVNGCTPTGTPNIVGKASININLIVYPNPTAGNVNVASNVGGILQICNLQGQCLAEYRISEGLTNINLPYQMPSGILFGKFYAKDGSRTSTRIVYQP
ncbi:MAG: T9SS type A sorting domain-containing protein [Bacteroidetes bacterium]|nr:T9SS type A sorting domain-containing protein [Bacteroidota bacterium]